MSEFLIKLAADYSMIPIVLIGAYALLFKIPNNRKLMAYSRILMAGLTAYLLAKIAGTFFQPESLRPFEELGLRPGASYLNNPGFPSDHILFATAITLAVWFETKQKVLSITLAVLVMIVGIGRILALVHTPLDIIGGLVIASLGSVWYICEKLPHTRHKQ